MTADCSFCVSLLFIRIFPKYSINMNEYDTYNCSEMKNICRVCLRTEQNLHTMSAEENNWYRILCCKVLNSEPAVSMCSICRPQLRKCIRFAMQCQEADRWFNHMVRENPTLHQILEPIYTQSLTTTPPKTYYVGPENILDNSEDTSLNFEDVYDNSMFEGDVMSEDEVPLVMLRSEEVEDKRRKRRKKKNENNIHTEMEIKTESDIKDESDLIIQELCEGKKLKKTKKTVKEGFSSRMVQETDQYVVIKLTKEQVLEEMKEKSNSEKYIRALYKCEKCVKGFNFEDVLRNHMERHTKENGEYRCDICTQYCPSMVSLRGHMKSHTTRYKCKVCGDIRLSRQHLLEHHAITHTSAATEYTCEHCYFTTNKRTVIQRHVKTHKPGERHTCHECGAVFQNIESLRVHSARHDKSRSLQCEYCARKFIYPSLLQKHVKSVHIHKDYYCVECDIRFKSPDNLKLHFKKAKRHRDSSSYTHQCPQCDEKFISLTTLSVHLTTTHGHPKGYTCDMCRRMYSCPRSQNHQCPQCDEKFISLTTLSVHLTTTHGHPKGYTCDVCRRMYSSRESLKGHIRRVHAERKLSCHVCEKSFTRKSILTAHLRTHTGHEALSGAAQLLESV